LSTGQSNNQKFGLRAGWNMATLAKENETPDTTYMLNSFYIGFSNETKIAPLLYWGKGIEYVQNGVEYNNNTKRIFHTISLPVNLKLKLGPVYARGGVAANFKISEKYKRGDLSYSPNKKASWFDVPVFLGAGVNILFLSVEARYHWGLIKATDDYYNRYFQLGAAISF
jgi:hypothetical protein